MKEWFIFLMLVGRVTGAIGQNFVGESVLPSIPDDGFYRIIITPDMARVLNEGCSNVRIYDGRNLEVPYLLEAEQSRTYGKQFQAYEIVEKRQELGCCTTLVLRNPNQRPLNNISLVIKNADVSKEAELVGSDDQQNWFALKEHFILRPTPNDKGISEIKILDFPLSNYSYYALRIDDSTSAPLNIIRAGYFEITVEEGRYTEIPSPVIRLTDSIAQKQSYFHLRFDTIRLVDKLVFSFTGPPFYLRKGSLYTPDERILRKGRKELYNRLIQEVRLTSKAPTVMMLDGPRVSELILVIDNADSPPLELEQVQAYQLDRYLVAFLKKGTNYRVKFGEMALQSPVYDIAFFSANIPTRPPEIEAGGVVMFKNHRESPGFTFFTTNAFIWVAVIIIIMVLGFMSVRMLKETGPSDRET